MTILIHMVSEYGWPAVASAAIVFILLRSEIRITYSGKGHKADD